MDVPYQIPTQWVQRSRKHVIVTLQYRLGLFGFPDSMALVERNLGLLDQRLAVKWVKQNIAAFGGDPSRIVLWGQSAGAIAIAHYSYAYANDPIATGFIMDSGTEYLLQGRTPPANSTVSSFSKLAQQVGCNTTSPTDQLACVRKVPAAKHVIVTLQYRLGLFGFPDSMALVERNLGLLDQRLAVKWVKQNIAAFGGDPSRIVLWGQSAGAIAIAHYSYAYANDPIATGFIMDSGTEYLLQGRTPPANSTVSSFSKLAQQVGCNTTSPTDQLACVRKVPAATLQDSVLSAGELFSPLVDNKNVSQTIQQLLRLLPSL